MKIWSSRKSHPLLKWTLEIKLIYSLGAKLHSWSYHGWEGIVGKWHTDAVPMSGGSVLWISLLLGHCKSFVDLYLIHCVEIRLFCWASFYTIFKINIAWKNGLLNLERSINPTVPLRLWKYVRAWRHLQPLHHWPYVVEIGWCNWDAEICDSKQHLWTM